MKSFMKKSIRETEVVIFIVILTIVFSFMQRRFFAVNTFIDIIEQASINCFLAIGVMFPIITGGIDLSIGSIVAIVACSCGWLSVNGVNPFVILIIGAVIGGAIGFINGFLVTKMRLQPFIATLGTQQIIRGIAYLKTGGWPILYIPDSFRSLLNGKFLNIRIFVYVMLITVGIFAYLLKRTRLGTYIYAIGGNKEAARLSGVNTKRVECMTYCISGLLAGLAGLVMLARLGAGEPSTADGYELDAIAAAAIGGASLAGGKGSAVGAIFGSIMIYVMKVGLIVIGMNSFVQFIAIGIVIIIAVYLDSLQVIVTDLWRKIKNKIK